MLKKNQSGLGKQPVREPLAALTGVFRKRAKKIYIWVLTMRSPLALA